METTEKEHSKFELNALRYMMGWYQSGVPVPHSKGPPWRGATIGLSLE